MADTATPPRALGNRRETLLFSAAVVLMAVALLSFFLSQGAKARNETWIETAHGLGLAAGDMAAAGEAAAAGRAPDFALLKNRQGALSSQIDALAGRNAATGIAPAPLAAADELDTVEAAWKTLQRPAQTVIDAEAAYQSAAQARASIAELITPAAADGKGLSAAYEQITQKLGSRDAAPEQMLRTAQQLVRIERINAAAQRALGREPQAALTALNSDLRTLSSEHASLLADGTIAGSLNRGIPEQLDTLRQAAAALDAAAPKLAAMQAAAAQMQAQSAGLGKAAAAFEQRLLDVQVQQKLLPKVVYIAGTLAILALAAFGALMLTSTRQRLHEAELRDGRQQQAILSLLDEITNLADGDLTVDVTVTEDFTGAIADSINYTVQNMRHLVGTIRTTSDDVADAAIGTQQTALKMSEASERQAREVVAITASISATAASMQDVAGYAEQLAGQAQTSVQIAHAGAETVNRTMAGMSSLREQIQDTSKRIKRLGESSQEIGNIIEFINDIAEQTNTLALNASIQAAMAGESGRGFAVVADEVQKLAERAANATRQIETLVKTIQADTQEAITSMERSTQNVVVGASSAEEAGRALSKVEASSQQLSTLITEIAGSARQQSAAATQIAGQMQAIRDIAVQTSGSANQTARAVGELTELSDKLRESVSGFKLPETMAA